MARHAAARIWLAAYLIVSLVDVVAEARHATRTAFVAVVLAMPALAGFLQAAKPRSLRLYTWVTAALFFSWLGDWVGDLLDPHVLVKIVFFFLGHLCFIAAFLPFRRNSVLHRPVWLLAYVVVIGALLIWIAPHAGGLAAPIVVYGAVLGTMAVLATGVNRRTGIGGAIFVASDLTIAVTTFVVPGIGLAEVLIMTSYLIAQLLIVLGVLAAPVPRGRP
jgi:uncharacterized membrane protein YhhN